MSNSFSIEASTISIAKTREERLVDDLQTFSNIEEDNLPLALAVCGANWQINDKRSLFFGIRNMNEDYFTSPVTSFFTNSSCGVYPTISANYDIANYPLASIGAHYKYENRNIALQASLYNGKGSYRFSGRENVFRFYPASDGIFGLVEATYSRRGSSYFVGTAVYWGDTSSKYNSGSSSNNIKGVSLSPWAYAEQRITDRLSLIAGYSHAFFDGQSVPGAERVRDATCRDFAGLGGRYAWQRAELGVFTDYANFAEGSEWATELTCKVALTPHFFLQPSVHAIFMPDATATFQGAATLRLGIIL